MLSYTAQDVALWILTEAQKCNVPVSPMKLQKLLYYCQGYNIGMCSEPLFTDKIEAWEHGPVVRSVYHAYRRHGALNITDFDRMEAPGNFRDLISCVLKDKGAMSATDLSKETHNESPYQSVERDTEITLDHMEKFFAPIFWGPDEQDMYEPFFPTPEEEKKYFKENFKPHERDAIFA